MATPIIPQSPSRLVDAAKGMGSRKSNPAQVLQDLQTLCQSLSPGNAIPARGELMRRFGVSERAVRRALDELEREGRIVRRQGSGTFIAEPSAPRVHFPRKVLDSRTIVAISAPDHAIFERAMALLFRHATDADATLVCRLVNPERHSLPILPSDEGDALGYVVFGGMLSSLAEQLYKTGNRTVLVGTPAADLACLVPTVQSDQELGGYLATRHLIDLGHRRIAFRGWSDWSKMRRCQGHRQALDEARKQGIAVEDSVIFEDQYSAWQQTPDAAKVFFARADAPTGIVVWNDHEAVPFLSLLAFIGVRVPEDISVIGYDNLPEGQRMYPPLSTVDVAMERQLQAAVKLLTRPSAPAPTHTTVVLPTLIPRGSTAPAKGAF